MKDDDGETDPVLQANFLKLMGETSVGRLRTAMEKWKIGTNAIQSARHGSKGLRLETLEKFAAYFGVEPYRFLLPELGKDLWPFNLLTPDHVKRLSEDQLETVQNLALDMIKRKDKAASVDLLARQNAQSQQGPSGTSPSTNTKINPKIKPHGKRNRVQKTSNGK